MQWRGRNKSSERGDQGGKQGSDFTFIDHVKDLGLWLNMCVTWLDLMFGKDGSRSNIKK